MKEFWFPNTFFHLYSASLAHCRFSPSQIVNSKLENDGKEKPLKQHFHCMLNQYQNSYVACNSYTITFIGISSPVGSSPVPHWFKIGHGKLLEDLVLVIFNHCVGCWKKEKTFNLNVMKFTFSFFTPFLHYFPHFERHFCFFLSLKRAWMSLLRMKKVKLI